MAKRTVVYGGRQQGGKTEALRQALRQAKVLGDASPRGMVLRWHRELALITGALSLAYGRTGLSRTALEDWAQKISLVADEMRAHARGPTRTSSVTEQEPGR